MAPGAFVLVHGLNAVRPHVFAAWCDSQFPRNSQG
jgi:hypothetical protein